MLFQGKAGARQVSRFKTYDPLCQGVNECDRRRGCQFVADASDLLGFITLDPVLNRLEDNETFLSSPCLPCDGTFS